MPTNGAGVYTVPGGINPVVAGTIIQDTWANPTLSDVAQGITDRLDRSGRGGMLAALVLFDGVVGTPGLSFTSEASSGLYRVSAGIVGFSILGTNVFRWGANGVAVPLGAIGTPSYSFLGDLNTGMWSPAADTIALSTAGVERLRVSGFNFFVNQDVGYNVTGFTANGLQYASTGAQAGSSFSSWQAGNTGPDIQSMHSRNATKGSHTIVQNGDVLFQIIASGSDGVEFQPAARILFAVDGTPGVGDMPGRILFYVTRDGAATMSEAMRISNTGEIELSSPAAGANTLTVGQVAGQFAIATVLSLSGGETAWVLQNSSNTANSTARLSILTAGATAGDPWIRIGNAVVDWSIGLDNSDSDAWVLSNDASLGTNNKIRVPTTGQISLLAGAYTPISSQAFTATPTFNCQDSNVFEFSGAMTANVTSCTLSNAVAGQTIQIRVVQDGTGGRTFASPSGAKITGSVGTTASLASILTLTRSSQGARWEGSWLQLPA